MKCPHCGIEFESTRFGQKYCSRRCAHRAMEKRNRDRGGSQSKKYEKRAARRSRAKDLVYADKVKRGCSHCSERRPNTLEYHHVDKTTKISTIAALVANRSLEAVKAEMEKCILLCSNCHAVEEHGEGYREF